MENKLIEELWEEHQLATFPKGYRGMDVSGIDFVMLDANVAGCVDTFLSRGNLNLSQTAILGLCYRNLSYVMPILNEEGATYYWRLERLAELVLRAVAVRNQKEPNKSFPSRMRATSSHDRYTRFHLRLKTRRKRQDYEDGRE